MQQELDILLIRKLYFVEFIVICVVVVRGVAVIVDAVSVVVVGIIIRPFFVSCGSRSCWG